MKAQRRGARLPAASPPAGAWPDRAPVPPAPSLADLAYERIKQKIVTCAIRPGEYLNEAQLASAIGIGRTPVRLATSRLMLDGLVQIMPRKGLLVKPLSLDEIIQIVEVRRINEPYCARLAAERATAADVADMRDVLERASQAIRDQDSELAMKMDHAFHICLSRAAANPVLAGLLQGLYERSLRYWFVSIRSAGHVREIEDEHGDVLSAIERRDPDAAERAMLRHIDSFHQTVTRFI